MSSRNDLGKADRLRGIALVLPALCWTAAFFILPFAAMLAMSTWSRVGATIEKTWDLSNYQAFFAKPHFIQALINSLEITVVVTVISILLAYPLAWIIAMRIPRHWQRLALILAILPFWTSYVVRSYAWLLWFSPRTASSTRPCLPSA